MSGPPRTPREVKRRRGTLRKDRDGGGQLVVLAPIAPVDKAPEPDERKGALDFIQTVLDSGANVWIGQTDLAALEFLRQVWQDRETARLLWLAPLKGENHLHDEKLFEAYDKLNHRLIQALSALGLDPTARARLGVAEVKRQSVIDRLENKRAARKAGRPAG